MTFDELLMIYDDSCKWWAAFAAQTGRLFDITCDRMEAAEAQLAAIRQALGGYPDSDLASLATTIAARRAAIEAQIEELDRYLDEVLPEINGRAASPVDRVVRLVSMLAANGTTPAELDAVVDSHTVDALVRRVETLEANALRLPPVTAQQLAHLINEAGS